MFITDMFTSERVLIKHPQAEVYTVELLRVCMICWLNGNGHKGFRNNKC